MTTSASISIPQPAEEEFQTERVLTITGGHFIHDTYTAFVAPLLPLIIDKLSLSLSMVGSLMAFMQLPAILNPFIGYLADKIRLRYFVIFAPAVTATLICSLGVMPSYAALGMILFLAGISVAAFHGPAPAMVSRISGNRIGKGMSFYMAGGELGRTIGPLLAVWAVSIWSLEGFYRIGVIGWATSLILLWRLKEIAGRTEKPGSLRGLLPTVKQLFIPLALVIATRSFMLVSMTTYLPIFMEKEGSNLWIGGASLSILELAGVGGALMAGTISDRLGRKPMLLVIATLSSLLMLVFLQVEGWLLVPVLLALGFTSLSTGPIYLALVQDHTPNNRAMGNGLYISISFLIRSLITFLIGLAGDYIGLQTTFFWSAILALFSIPAILALPKVDKKP
jgi:FSR family fosmidomycin resistance protein-like MFS transporter